ncbi:MAG: hypothetical protein QXN26_04945, partial [Thermoplasmataceae archaeon]
MQPDPVEELFGMMDDEKYEEVLEKVDKMIAADNENSLLHALKAMALLELDKDSETALKEANIAYRKSQEPFFKYVRGWALSENDNLKEGLKLLNQASEEDPDNIQYLIKLAEVYEDDDRPQDALKAIIRAQRVEPDDVRLALMKAGFLNTLERSREAVTELKRVNSKYPEFDYPYFILSESYLLLDDLKNAENAIDTAIRLSKQADSEYYERSAQIRIAGGDLENAISSLDLAMNAAGSDEERVIYLLEKVKAMSFAGKADEGERILRDAYEKNSENALYYYSLVDNLSDQGKKDDIEQLIKERNLPDSLATLIRVYTGIYEKPDESSVESSLSSLHDDINQNDFNLTLSQILLDALMASA